MDSCIEVLSDSNDTIIFSLDDDNLLKKQDLRDSDVEIIVNKYITKISETSKLNKTDVISERLEHSCCEDLKKSSCRKNEPSSSSQDDTKKFDNEIVLRTLSEKYKQRSVENICLNTLESVSDKEVRKLKRQQKSEEQKRKKLEVEQEKSLKQALAAENKNIKPGECMKFLCVHLDSDIVNDEYGYEIVNTLEAADVRYTIESQVFPNTISWSRKIQSHSINDDGKIQLSSKDSDTNDILLVMKCKEFLEHVQNNSLISHIQSLNSVLVNKNLTLLVYGLQNYIQFQKKRKQKEFASNISNDVHQHLYQNFPQVSNKNIEYALTELQILCNCSHRLLESPSEVALTISQFSKSVAEIPYKLKKQEKYQQMEWFAAGDNKDSVKVDRNGNGLQRLWKQMLTTFPLANLETAEAIIAIYPSVTSLMQAYEDSTIQKPELLLQDIPIRRAAGPLSATRRLGPELSKKVYNYLTSMDGNILL